MNLDLLSGCSLFKALDQQQLNRVAMGMRRVSLPSGTILFHQHDRAEHYYVVESGVIKLTLLSQQGEEKVLELIRPSESFAEAVLFMQRSDYPVSAQSIDDAVVWALKGSRLIELLRSENALALDMLGQLSMRVHDLLQEVEKLTLNDAMQRLVNYLIEECERSHSTCLPLSAPKQVIASRLGITPETFSRLVLRLRSANVLELRKAQLTVKDLKALKSYLSKH